MNDLASHRSKKAMDDLAIAVLNACGIPDHSAIRGFTFTASVDDIPRLEVEYMCLPSWETFNLDGLGLRTTSITFVPQGMEAER